MGSELHSMAKVINDYHIHTVYSDGMYEPEQLFKKAQELKLAEISITDHNKYGGVLEAIKGDYAQKYGVGFVNGCEFYAWHKNYFFDVLCYGFDAEKIQKEPRLTLERQNETNFAILRDLAQKAKELKLTLDEEVLYSTHIRSAYYQFYKEISRYPENAEFIQKWPMGEAFRHTFPENPMVINFKKYYADIFEIREIVDRIGGVLVFAHPYNKYPASYGQQFVDDCLATGCFDGIECFHYAFGKDKSDYLLNVAKRNKMIITGGSDNHNTKYDLGKWCRGQEAIIPNLKLSEQIKAFKTKPPCKNF